MCEQDPKTCTGSVPFLDISLYCIENNPENYEFLCKVADFNASKIIQECDPNEMNEMIFDATKQELLKASENTHGDHAEKIIKKYVDIVT